MTRSRIGVSRLAGVLAGLAFVLLTVAPAGANEGLLLDDFSDGVSAVGTRWQAFTDRVMGGVSDITAGFVRTQEGSALQMTGSVSTANNGGFIQVRLPMSARGSYDASGYAGVYLTVRGEVDRAYLWLRTDRTNRPWLHYAAELPVGEEWRRIELPFADFEGERRLRGTDVDADALRSVAIVAANGDFEAAIQVLEIGFYR